jgi:leucyl-tRNA synthetase
VVDQAWPQADEGALVKDSVELVVQVNGKVRGRISVAADAGDELVIDTALAEPNVKRFMQGRALRKTIVVAGRLVNLVVA